MFKALIARLQSEIKTVLDPLIHRGMKVAMLDYPYHSNVGDSLIWLGEIEYLKYRDCKICFASYLAMHTSESQLAALENVDVILLHGGGNFGTLWPQFQKFREVIIQRFPHKEIIQFPQSVFFDNESDLTHTLKLLAAHPKLTILARDQLSYKILRSNTVVDVKLCPDMAFMLGDLSAVSQRAEKKAIYLSRNDKEKLHVDFDFQSDLNLVSTVITTDWLEESMQERVLIKIERRLIGILLRVWHDKKACMHLLNGIAEQRKIRGIKILSQGEMVITDRLHAHILSVLLGKRSFILDNNNNKLGAFYKTWMADTPGIHFLETDEVQFTEIVNLINLYSSQDAESYNERH